MIPRYTRPQMGAIWSEENRYRHWLAVEVAACEVLAEMGVIPEDAVTAIKSKANFSVERIQEIEKEVKHDVIAFTTSVAEFVGPESRYVHYGLTSSDVVDTALALQLKAASGLLIEGLNGLLGALKKRAYEHKMTVMIGRTHGIHAEPTTLGLKITVWYEEARRNLRRLQQAVETVSVGKISGAVGTFAHLDPQVEEAVCRKLGLQFDPVSTQIVQRDRHAEFMAALAITAASLEKIALEVRGLQRTEVREVEEYFAPGQKGSSAMPHKRNPVTCEQICGLARLVRSNLQAALENIALWHERDISHSSVERVILPDSAILLDYLLAKTTQLIEKMFVYPQRMLENLNLMKGLVFSGQLLLDLTKKGVTREEAYYWVQRNSMRVWANEGEFHKLVLADEDIARYLSQAEIERTFDLKHQLRHVDYIYQRVYES
ncbi:MAG: adenylosuccinate lyase [Acidobacteria bacterium]|nr:adenylosuccinate lyase [Acidobacteriota bacterium]MCI0723337.1 adenylosuccinate lyase [Acidobacteriota bacterium]